MPRGHSQKATSKSSRRTKKKHNVCSGEGCNVYLNEYDQHTRCVACLSPKHLRDSQTNHPCSPCQSLSSSYRSRKHRKTGLPQFPERDPALSYTGSVPASEASYRPSEAHGSALGSPQSSRDRPISTTYPGEGVGNEPLDTVDLPPLAEDQGDSVLPPAPSEEGAGIVSGVV